MTLHLARIPYDFAALVRLIKTEFAYMERRINPATSAQFLTEDGLADLSRSLEIWVIGQVPVACIVMTVQANCLYLGKLAIAKSHRRQGLARALIEHAAVRAIALGLPSLELQTRIELIENHATFKALGFVETARTCHPGFTHPTTITFRKLL